MSQCMHKKAPRIARCFFCVINIRASRRETIEKKLRWANKEEAKAFAKQAEKLGNLGMRYVACCDYLGWDPEIRREIMAKQRAKSRTSGNYSKGGMSNEIKCY